MERCSDFFLSKYKIPTKIWKDGLTGELTKEDYRTVDEVSGLLEFLDEDKMYIANYQPRATLF